MSKSWETPYRPDCAKPNSPDEEARERHRYEDGVYRQIDHRKIDESFLESASKLQSSPFLMAPYKNPFIEMLARLALNYYENPFDAFMESLAMYLDTTKELLIKKDINLRANKGEI